ncbi:MULTISPECIES: hypothetical protein [Streptomyces]|uniref:Uncharacterized protein n=1 Tax=Streptomyces solicathayae TaxID=3081768 RepID=A0ABZ0LYD5_9ACTN|nr:hypothetical protein [Streptomyces sp. HUAS YS2]WOX24535.1 hypothetical protein R2D22_25400 [Streptomyces sp. HUAS YS2]
MNSADPGAPFGPRSFQLVLLRRMADHQPGLVEDALRELGATRSEMREANRIWQSWAHARRGPGELHRYRQALGEPVARRAVAELGVALGALSDPEAGAEILQWDLPLWPDLRWEVLTGRAGPKSPPQVWGSALTRTPGASSPVLRTAADLRPWGCTFGEVRHAFPDAVPREGDAPTRSRLDFTDRDGTVCAAEFTWGLFQRLRRLT